MARRFKHPAEFLQEQRAALVAAFTADNMVGVERRRRAYHQLYIRAKEIAADPNTRNADTAEKYMEVFTDLLANCGEAGARKLGVFEPNLDVSNFQRIADYVDLYVDEEEPA